MCPGSCGAGALARGWLAHITLSFRAAWGRTKCGESVSRNLQLRVDAWFAVGG